MPAGFGAADFTQIAFAGSQALVAASRVAERDADVLVNDGRGGASTRMRTRCCAPCPGAQQLFTVAGLPDGGAVAAGRDVVLIRDSAGSPWRFSDQPLPGSMVIAAAATREGGRVRPVVSIVRALSENWRYPPVDDIGEQDPNQPLPLLPAYPLPPDGFVLRETAGGWARRAALRLRRVRRRPAAEVRPGARLRARRGRPGLGRRRLERRPGRRGQRLLRARRGRQGRSRARPDGGGVPLRRRECRPPGAAASPVGLPAGPARFAVGGHAACQAPCADLALQDIRPDRSLVSALAKVAGLRAQPNGPRMMLYTGGRLGARRRRAASRRARWRGTRRWPARSRAGIPGRVCDRRAGRQALSAPRSRTSSPRSGAARRPRASTRRTLPARPRARVRARTTRSTRPAPGDRCA